VGGDGDIGKLLGLIKSSGGGAGERLCVSLLERRNRKER